MALLDDLREDYKEHSHTSVRMGSEGDGCDIVITSNGNVYKSWFGRMSPAKRRKYRPQAEDDDQFGIMMICLRLCDQTRDAPLIDPMHIDTIDSGTEWEFWQDVAQVLAAHRAIGEAEAKNG